MIYTKEQAEQDRTRMLATALEHERGGDPVRAGILRVEAENCLDRVGMRKVHKASLGPYTESRPKTCLDCGLFGIEWAADDECVVADKSN